MVKINRDPSFPGGEIGPTKSIPIWCHGDFTGIGFNSGTPVVNFLLILWHTSQLAICTDISHQAHYTSWKKLYHFHNIFDQSMPCILFFNQACRGSYSYPYAQLLSYSTRWQAHNIAFFSSLDNIYLNNLSSYINTILNYLDSPITVKFNFVLCFSLNAGSKALHPSQQSSSFLSYSPLPMFTDATWILTLPALCSDTPAQQFRRYLTRPSQHNTLSHLQNACACGIKRTNVVSILGANELMISDA